jgi:hypothetical protein
VKHLKVSYWVISQLIQNRLSRQGRPEGKHSSFSFLRVWPGKTNWRERLSTFDLLVPSSLGQLLLKLKTLFTFLQKRANTYEEVNCTEPSPSVSVPWSGWHFLLLSPTLNRACVGHHKVGSLLPYHKHKTRLLWMSTYRIVTVQHSSLLQAEKVL